MQFDKKFLQLKPFEISDRKKGRFLVHKTVSVVKQKAFIPGPGHVLSLEIVDKVDP